MPASSDVFVFADFRFDRAGGGLFRRDDHGAFAPVTIGSRALDLLAVLIERRGDAVSKEEIMAAVWPKMAVEEANLFVQISALRAILDREQSGQSCIQTITGRGYRFIAPVKRCAGGMDSHTPAGPHEHFRLFPLDSVKPSVPLANARSPEPQPSSISPAERRQLTVMICELVGASELSARLDPEDLREVIAAYHRIVGEIVARFDGLVGKYMGEYMGEAVLVYFGYPQAHEDDGERAVRAGLSAVNAVSRLDVKSVKLQTRVGIATGLVVVGDFIGAGSAQEQSVVGETPHLAGRLKALAEPGAVVIAASTRRLVGDLFEYRDLGAVEVNGVATPAPAWQVLRPNIVASRFEALRGSALTTLVGRDEEIDLLLRRWARTKAGAGQIVLISGEPGLGKSRIAAALQERLPIGSHLRLRYFCSPYYQDSALFPFIDQLGRASEFERDDTPDVKLGKLEAVLARAAPPDEDMALLADLMSLPASGRYPSSEPQSPAEEGSHIGGADPPARGSGAPAAGAHGFRGRALDRPDVARSARPRRRADTQPAGSVDCDIPP